MHPNLFFLHACIIWTKKVYSFCSSSLIVGQDVIGGHCRRYSGVLYVILLVDPTPIVYFPVGSTTAW